VTKRAKKPQSLFRRLVYFAVMLMTGGGAGIGGWFFKDYPQLRAITEAVLGKSDEGEEDGASDAARKAVQVKARLATAVTEAFTSDPKRPGVYKVRITELALDPKQFTPGRTVDIQAEVRTVDADGKSTLVWESKAFGENLAVVGRDELAVDWNKRPFEVAWRPGDQIVVAVWDRKSSVFSPKTFKMALPKPGTFPLSSGPHALAVAGANRSAVESDLNRIVFESQRAGEAPDRPALARKGSDRPSVDASERTIVIK
jgi:hypothetical protein